MSRFALLFFLFSTAATQALAQVGPGLNYNQLVLEDEPVAYWRLDEASGPFLDQIGSHAATHVSGTVATEVDGALIADSNAAISSGPAGGTLSVPFDPTLNSAAFSIELWAQFASNCAEGIGSRCSLAGSPQAGPLRGYNLGPVGTASGMTHRFELGAEGSSPAQYVLDGPPVVLGEWTHLVGTYDGTIQRLYVNGEPVASQPANFAPESFRPLELFGSAAEAAENVTLDEVAYYDEALNPSRIASHYAAGVRDPAAPMEIPNALPYALAAGNGYSCVLDDIGVHCWGSSATGTQTVPPLSNPTAVDAGISHTCAVDDNGVQCWGGNPAGQTNVPPLSNPFAVAAGGRHSCAIDDTGVVCWGSNTSGQTTVPPLSNPTVVSAGGGFTCAVDDNGVTCWGSNSAGQTTVPPLSNPTTVAASGADACAIDDNGVVCWGSVAPVPPLANPVTVATAANFSCAIDDTGVVCWGSNSDGRSTPPPMSNPTALATGTNHACALADDGVQCWGQNRFGATTVEALPNPTTFVSGGAEHTCALGQAEVVCWGLDVSLEPTLLNPTALSSGGGHNCAIDDNGVECWGDDRDGQATPPPITNPTIVSAGVSHSCALGDGGVQCWGDGTVNATNVRPLTNPSSVSAGRSHSCALDDNGVQCWGFNSQGQTSVPALSNPTFVTASFDHTCVIDDNEVKCWGRRYLNGQSVVPPLSNPVFVTGGEDHTCTLDDNGVQCWGNNFHGQSTVPPLSNPTQVSAGENHTCALDDDGLHCWGDNSKGQTSIPRAFFFVDFDGDSIPNITELTVFSTDPLSSDTDGDGLSDGEEIDTYHTDPLLIDTDGDGRSDGVEVNVAFTDPLVPGAPLILLNTNAHLDSGIDDFAVAETDGFGNWVAAWRSTDDLAGTIGTDTDILTSHSRDNGTIWTAPTALNSNAPTDGAQDAWPPSLTTNRMGLWIASWATTANLGGTIGGDFDIVFARSTDHGAHWTAPVPLDPSAGTDSAYDDRITLGYGDGIFVALWHSQGGLTGPDFEIRLSRSTDAGKTWSQSVLLTSNVDTDAWPSVATDGMGHWVAVWESEDSLLGGDGDLMTAGSSDGGLSWSAPAPLNTNAASDSGDDKRPHVATDGFGTWLAVWDSRDDLGNQIGTDRDILFSRSTDNGANWSPPAALDFARASIDAADDWRPDVATDLTGAWTVVWQSDEDLNGLLGADWDLLLSQSSDDGATWAAGTALNDDAETDAGGNFFPRIASQPAGAALVTWHSDEDTDNAVANDVDVFFKNALTSPPVIACSAAGTFNPSTATLGMGEHHYCEDWHLSMQTLSTLQDSFLARIDLSGSTLYGSSFARSDLTGADLSHALLSGSGLQSVILAGADLTGASVILVDFSGAMYDQTTKFPSGNTVEAGSWGLDNSANPWDLGMRPVPEPASWLLLVVGSGTLLGLAAQRRQRAAAKRNPHRRQADSPS